MTVRLGELAVRFGCQLRGDPELGVEAVSTLEAARPGTVTFLANARYRKFLPATRATAVILEPAYAEECPGAALLSANPYAIYARVAALLHPAPQAPAGVHASAVIGADSHLVARVTLGRDAVIGARAILHPGSVVGADGFGFAREPAGWVKVPQLGAVRIGDDVEIGANTTIDRGAIEDTVIEEDVKLDNQIQIGHNVRIGAHTAIAGCVGISGSTTIGKRCMIGGAVGIAGHLTIADDVMITGLSLVSRSITKAGIYSSALPLEDARLFRRNAARFRHLDEWYRLSMKGRAMKDGDDPSAADPDEDNDD